MCGSVGRDHATPPVGSPLPLPHLCADFIHDSSAPFWSFVTVPQHERHGSCSMAYTVPIATSPRLIHCTIPSRHVISSPYGTYLCKRDVCMYCHSRARVNSLSPFSRFLREILFYCIHVNRDFSLNIEFPS